MQQVCELQDADTLDHSVKLKREILKSRINVLAKQWQPEEADYAAAWSLIMKPCSRAAVQTGVLPAPFSLESPLEPPSHGPLPAH